MSEKLRTGPEQEKKNPELDHAGNEKHAELERSREQKAERAENNNVEKLQESAERAAEKEKKVEDKASPEKPKKLSPATRRQREKAEFAANMNEARSHMSKPSRSFSKVIHTPAVEKTSEAVGSTVARPNAVLAGSVSALVFTLGFYLFARHYGYPLSGFETIGAFILGWIVGLLFDYLRVMVTGRPSA